MEKTSERWKIKSSLDFDPMEDKKMFVCVCVWCVERVVITYLSERRQLLPARNQRACRDGKENNMNNPHSSLAKNACADLLRTSKNREEKVR